MTLELTTQEAQVLVNLIDLAVKSVGMQAAEAAVVLTKKIVDASKAQEAAQTEIKEAA